MAERKVVCMSFCPKCGNTGIDIDGNPCTCKFNTVSFFETVSCLDIPEQYRGLQFNNGLVPKDLNESYPAYLQQMYSSIIAGKWKQHNTVLCSPIGHSKTVLAYSCIEVLFRNGIDTFPIYDIFEIKRMLMDMDLCKKQIYGIEHPELIITVPILFVKIPRVTTWETYDMIAMILDRRVRRGCSTIYLYDGSWQQLIYGDRNDILSGLLGDGAYNTLESKSWFIPRTEKELPEVKLEDNIG